MTLLQIVTTDIFLVLMFSSAGEDYCRGWCSGLNTFG